MKNSEVKKTLREWSTDPDFLDEVAFMELMSRFVLDVVVFLEDNGISKKDLAKAAGISLPRLNRVLSLDSNFSLRTVARISRAIGKTPRVIFDNESTLSTVE